MYYTAWGRILSGKRRNIIRKYETEKYIFNNTREASKITSLTGSICPSISSLCRAALREGGLGRQKGFLKKALRWLKTRWLHFGRHFGLKKVEDPKKRFSTWCSQNTVQKHNHARFYCPPDSVLAPIGNPRLQFSLGPLSPPFCAPQRY